MPRELTGAEEVAFNRYQAFGTPEEVQKVVQDVERLKTENAERRQANKDLTAEVEKLKAATPEGSVVLAADEAKAYEALKASGVALADVPKVVEERDTLKTKAADRDKRDALGKAVETEGWVPESASLLHRLLGETPVELKQERLEVTEGGKKVTKEMLVGYVTVAGKSVRLSEWAEAEQLPASIFTARAGGQSKEQGRDWVPQRGAGGGKGKDATAEDFAASTAKTANYDSF